MGEAEKVKRQVRVYSEKVIQSRHLYDALEFTRSPKKAITFILQMRKLRFRVGKVTGPGSCRQQILGLINLFKSYASTQALSQVLKDIHKPHTVMAFTAPPV